MELRLNALLLLVLMLAVRSSAATTVYHSTGNGSVGSCKGPHVAFGDPTAQAFLVARDDQNGVCPPADDPMDLGGAAEQWLSSGFSSNGTSFGPSLRGLAVFGIRGTALDVGTYDAVTITFFVRVHSAAARGLLFAIIENVWEDNRTHPIADELHNASASLGVYTALLLDGTGQIEYVSSAPAKRQAVLKGAVAALNGEWHHIAVIINWAASSMQLFIDGRTSYTSEDWFECIAGESSPVPETVSSSVAARFASAPATVVLPNGAAVFGYGGEEMSLGLFQVHDQMMTETEIAALSGHMEHVSVGPGVGYSVGAALLLLCVCAVVITVYTTWTELQLNDAEPEHRITLTEAPKENDAPREAWADAERKVTIVDALAEGGGMAGQAASSIGRAADSISLVMRMSNMGSVVSESEGFVQKLVVIVPMALAPLQGLSLYIRGWQWPPEFVAAVEYLAIPITVDLPFVFPSVPSVVFLTLKFLLAMVIVIAVLRYVMRRDDAAFESVLVLRRALQDMYSETIRLAVSMELDARSEDSRLSSIMEMSQVIAAAGKEDWTADDVKRVASLSDADAETIVGCLRLLPPPRTLQEAALQQFAVSNMQIDSSQRAVFLSRCHDMASAINGTGRSMPCSVIARVIGGVDIGEKGATTLAKHLLRVGASLTGDDLPAGPQQLKPIEKRIAEYCKANGIDVPHDEEEEECILRAKILPQLAKERRQKPAPAPGAPPPFQYIVQLQSEATTATYIACEGAGRDALLRAADTVCRTHELERSFMIHTLTIKREDWGQHEDQATVILRECYVQAKFDSGGLVQLRVLGTAPDADDNSAFSLCITVRQKMVCPMHVQSLMEAQPEHFRVCAMDALPSTPYRCVHSGSVAFKICEATRCREAVRPCSQDVLYVCPEATCSFTVCGHCARLTLKDKLRTTAVTMSNTMGAADLYRILFIVVLALMFPLTQDGIMVLACHPSIRCILGVGQDGRCYGPGATASFIVSACVAVLAVVVFRVGVVLWLHLELRSRKLRVDEAVKTKWKGALHPEWNRFLEADDTVLSGLYRKYELPYFLSEQPWLLVVQLGSCLAVALTDPNSLLQLIAASSVELGSLAYLMLTDPFIDVWQDLLAKAAAVHQLLQLALMFFHRAAAAQSPIGSSGKVVAVMLLVGFSYLAFFAFVLWKRVILPLRQTHREETAEGLLRQQRLFLSMPDTKQSAPLMNELAKKFRETFGDYHFLSTVAAAHAFVLSRDVNVDARTHCIKGLQRIDPSLPLGIRWKPLSQLDENVRAHIGMVLSATVASDAERGSSEINQVTRQIRNVLGQCRKQHDRSFTAGNLLTLVSQLKETKHASNFDFSCLQIRHADASDAVFNSFSFESALIEDSVLKGTVFCEVNLKGVKLNRVRFSIPTTRPLMTLGPARSSAQFSPEGTVIAYPYSGTERALFEPGGTDVSICDAATGQLIPLPCRIDGGKKSGALVILSVIFSPDGKCLVCVCQDDALRLWSVESMQPLPQLFNHSHVYGATFSPDGALLSWANNTSPLLLLWDPATATVPGDDVKIDPVETFDAFLEEESDESDERGMSLLCASFSPTGDSIVTGHSGGLLKLWSIKERRVTVMKCVSAKMIVPEPDGQSDNPFDLDLKHVASIGINTTGALIPRKSLVYTTAVFLPDGKHIVSGSSDCVIRIWHVASAQCLQELKGHAHKIRCIALSPDGNKIASGSRGKDDKGCMMLWDASTWLPLGLFSGNERKVNAVSFSHDGRKLLSLAEDDTLKIWNAGTCDSIVSAGHTGIVSAAVFSPDGSRIASVSSDATARVWDTKTGRTVAEMKGHTLHVRSASFAPDGKTLVTSSWDKTLKLWDTATGHCIATLTGHTDLVRWAQYFLNGTRIVSISRDKTLRLWSSGGETIAVMKGHTSDVIHAAVSPDNTKIVSSSFDKTLRIWDAQTAFTIFVLSGHDKPVSMAQFSFDNKFVVSASYDTTVRIWVVATGEMLAQLNGHEKEVYTVAFSPDGSKVVSASHDETVKLWCTSTAQLIRTIMTNTDYDSNSSPGEEEFVMDLMVSPIFVWTASFSPDGTRILCVSADSTVRIWDTETGEPRAEFANNDCTVVSATFSPDGSAVLSTFRDGTMKLWNVMQSAELRPVKEDGVFCASRNEGGRFSIYHCPLFRKCPLIWSTDNPVLFVDCVCEEPSVK